jgi:hypothetical protein
MTAAQFDSLFYRHSEPNFYAWENPHPDLFVSN